MTNAVNPSPGAFGSQAIVKATGSVVDPATFAGNNQTVQVVPGEADTNIPNQMGSTEYAGQVVGSPNKFFTLDNPATTNVNEDMNLSNRNSATSLAGTTLNSSDPKYNSDPNAFNIGTNQQVQPVQTQTSSTFDVSKTENKVLQNGQMTGAQGSLSSGSVIDDSNVNIKEADMMAKDALKASASQNIMSIIDTSTVSGKILAQTLGEGNYTDKKATMLGQLDILSKEFVDSNGEPKIPTWAAGTARSVSKIAAFKGMTGSAATSAMAQAIMEASLPIAQEESKFYQTVTLQNLNNRQEATLNRANVLAKMDLANLDNRMAAAVQNSKSFISMDLANLDNDQQARVINTQARVQSILEDAKQENVKRMFTAESQNELDKFYDQLNTGISQFNSAQTTDISKFNSTMASTREQFYKDMQYNIDTSNAKWRQSVATQEDNQNFEAAAFDVKNMVGISTEALNQVWDRADALLDYAWKSGESELERGVMIAVQTLKNSGDLDIQKLKNFGDANIQELRNLGEVEVQNLRSANDENIQLLRNENDQILRDKADETTLADRALYNQGQIATQLLSNEGAVEVQALRNQGSAAEAAAASKSASSLALGGAVGGTITKLLTQSDAVKGGVDKIFSSIFG